MSLKLMYITNDVKVASIAERSGVDRIFVDMEYIGKSDRQGGMDTVQSCHTIDDIKAMRSILTESELLVRCNPVHDEIDGYPSTEDEINAVVEAGADILMLPYFKTTHEVKRFLTAVNKRVKTILLLETPEAVAVIKDILKFEGIDEIFVGLNDLSLGMGKKFMFEVLADGTVEKICKICDEKGIPYGFGGIASLGKGDLMSEHVIMEHYRLKSSGAILSRSFCNIQRERNLDIIENMFIHGVSDIRRYEKYCAEHPDNWESNRQEVIDIVANIAAGK